MPETDGRVLASEPLDTDDAGWTSIPANSFVTMNGCEIAVEPFL